MHPNFWAVVLMGFCLLQSGMELQAGKTLSGTGRLIVVAPAAFRSELREFLHYKNRSLKAELVSLETILKKSPGVDDPEKLKRFLYEEWRQHGLDYALLVGDVNVFPVRYMVLDRITPAAFDYSFYPSDLYYADLAKANGTFEDWNAQKESFHTGYFGEVRGEKNKQDPINFDQIDYSPEIAVGRWPIETLSELKLIINKTIAFEQSIPANASTGRRERPTVALLAVSGWVDSRKLLDKLADKLDPAWQVEKRFYSDSRHARQTPPPNRSELVAVLQRGTTLVVHTGHGQPDAWEKCFAVRDLDALTNSLTPVFVSAGCSTAYFAPLAPYDGYLDVYGFEHSGTDHGEIFNSPPSPPAPYQRARFNPTGLGEQVLKRNRFGGVAYIGCNTGSQPCALTLVEGFLNALSSSSHNSRLGECWNAAIRHYYQKENLDGLKPDAGWYPPSIFFQPMKFMVFGDPSLRLP